MEGPKRKESYSQFGPFEQFVVYSLIFFVFKTFGSSLDAAGRVSSQFAINFLRIADGKIPRATSSVKAGFPCLLFSPVRSPGTRLLSFFLFNS